MKNRNVIGMKEIRERLQLSHSELAELMGVSRSMFTKIENGYRKMPEAFGEIFLTLSSSVSNSQKAETQLRSNDKLDGQVPKKMKLRIRFIQSSLILVSKEIQRLQVQQEALLLAQKTFRVINVRVLKKKEDRDVLGKWVELQIIRNERKLRQVNDHRILELRAKQASLEAELGVLMSGY